MKQVAKVNAKAVAAASLFQAGNDVRYYLNGVLIEPFAKGKGVCIVATDGTRLVVITDPHGEADETMIVNFEPIAITKMKAKSSDHVRILKHDAYHYADVIGNHTATLKELRNISYAQIIDGKYPNWRQVINYELPEESAQMTTVDSGLLYAFCDAAKILQDTRVHPIMMVNGKDPNTPVSVLMKGAFAGDLHFRGVLMPMKYENKDFRWMPEGEA